MRSRLLSLLITVIPTVLVSPAAAKPQHLRSLQEHYGPFLGKGLATCGTCHQAAAPAKPPASLADFPHNDFGKRLAAVAAELRAEGQRTDIPSRLRRIAGEDADGDGVPNQVELVAGRRPGDPKDHPTPAELAVVRKREQQLAAFLAAYRWRPLEKVQRPAVPTVKSVRWVRNPIDAFVAAEHEKRGLKPRPEASKEVLLRRVYLDLIGLIPMPEERRAFLEDTAPDAYERVVDRLLASPHYGERWGRHWMDVWRYSDWTGYGEQVRDSQPHVWKWRDWIVDSLNEDKGYDRMIVEMLAGDEVAPLDENALRATGYLVRNYKLLSREKWMQDVVDHTGQAFLGLTVGCARCHDHMYDPITQKEYYRLRAVFEPHQIRTDWVNGELDLKKDGLPRAYDAKLEAQTFLYVRGDERQPQKDEPLAPGVPESLGGSLKIESVALPLLARAPERQPHVVAALRAQAEQQVRQAQQALAAGKNPEETALAQVRVDAAEAQQASVEAVLKVEALEDGAKKGSREWNDAALAATRAQRRQAQAEALLKRVEAGRAVEKSDKAARPNAAAARKAREDLAAAEAAVLKAETELKAPESTAYQPRGAGYPETSSGRRLALANWIACAENPLTARVAINQVWMRHFGQGLVPSVADFGRNGVLPTHPQLLDWLAAELAGGPGAQRPTPNAQPWRMKAIHRLIVTSSTYRMVSTPDPIDLAKDPDNRYLWRMPSRRMDAELVRDNVLYAAGQLEMRLGGPDIDQNLGLTVKRRSIYFRSAPEKEMVFLNLFDGPNPVECYARKETVVPQQALAMANSELALTQARLLAWSLLERTGADPERFVNTAFERVLSRAPGKAELAECVSFLAHQARLLVEKLPAAEMPKPGPRDGSAPSSDPSTRARENLVLVLLNHNDFVTIR